MLLQEVFSTLLRSGIRNSPEYPSKVMHLSSSSPRGGPRAVGGGIGDFVGISQRICAPEVGEMKGL